MKLKKPTNIIFIAIMIGIVACNSEKKQGSLKEEHSLTTTGKNKRALTDYENLKFSTFYQDFENDISGRTLISTNSPGKITGIILIDKEKGHYAIDLDTTYFKADMPKGNEYWEFSSIDTIKISHIEFVKN